MKNSTARSVFIRIGLALFLIAAISSLLQLIGFCSVSWLVGAGYISTDRSWLMWLITFVPMYAVGIPIGLLVLRKVPTQDYSESKLGAKNFFILLSIGICVMYAGNLVGTGLSHLLSGGTAQNVLERFVFDSNPLKIVVMVILAPVLEELVFRKQIIDRCARYGEKTAILFSALTFGFFHMNLFQFFYAFGLGLVFAYVYIRTRRLKYPVIMHMIINFMGSVLAPWIMSKVDLSAVADSATRMTMTEDALMGIIPGLMLYGAYVLLLLGWAITGLIFFIIKVRKFVFLPAAEELPRGQRFKTVYCNPWIILFMVLCIAVCAYALFA